MPDEVSKQQPQQGEKPRVLRTLADDSRQFLSNQKVSLIEMIARQERRGSPLLGYRRKIPWKVVGIVVLIVFIAASASYWFFIIRNPIIPKQVIENPLFPKPLVVVDKVITVPVAENIADYASVFAGVEVPALGRIFQIIPMRNSVALTSLQFLDTFRLNVPNTLRNNLSDRYTLFSVGVDEQGALGIILEVSAFENAFSGMLIWERTILRDMRSLGALVDDSELSDIRFSDVILANNDARIAYDENGVFRLGYVIFNRRLVLISPSRDALTQALARLLAAPQ